MNEYIALLEHDHIQIKHPITKNPVQLYRIIAKKDFIVKGVSIKRYDIGGFASSLDCFINQPSWLLNTSRLFDSATISDTILYDSSLVFGNAKLISCEVFNNSRIYGNTIGKNSSFHQNCECFESPTIDNCKIKNSVKIFGNCNLIQSTFTIGATVFENATVKNSEISDISMIKGNAIIENCKYSGRVIKSEGYHKNETLDLYIKLNITEGLD